MFMPLNHIFVIYSNILPSILSFHPCSNIHICKVAFKKVVYLNEFESIKYDYGNIITSENLSDGSTKLTLRPL